MAKTQNNNLEVIEAAGGILWRSTSTGEEVAIIHRLRYGDWTLPKGKREPGETWTETALREVYEETGCLAQLRDFAGGQIYTVDWVPKVVLYWHMHLLQEQDFKPNNEVDRMLWLHPHKARSIMTYPTEKEFIVIK